MTNQASPEERPRCPSVHPRTGKRCTGRAGHDDQHDPEAFTGEEMTAISNALAVDTKALIEKWAAGNAPATALVAAAGGLFVHLAEAVEIDTPTLIHGFFALLGVGEPGKSVSNQYIIIACAKLLGEEVEVEIVERRR